MKSLCPVWDCFPTVLGEGRMTGKEFNQAGLGSMEVEISETLRDDAA